MKSAKVETDEHLLFRNQFLPEREKDEHYRDLLFRKIQVDDKVIKKFDGLLNNGYFEDDVKRRVNSDTRTANMDKK